MRFPTSGLEKRCISGRKIMEKTWKNIIMNIISGFQINFLIEFDYLIDMLGSPLFGICNWRWKLSHTPRVWSTAPSFVVLIKVVVVLFEDVKTQTKSNKNITVTELLQEYIIDDLRRFWIVLDGLQPVGIHFFFKWQGQGVSFRSQEVMGQLGWQWTRWVTWWHGIHQPGFPGQMNQSDMIFRVTNMVGWKITMILIWCSQLEIGIFLGDSSNLLQWFPHLGFPAAELRISGPHPRYLNWRQGNGYFLVALLQLFLGDLL